MSKTTTKREEFLLVTNHYSDRVVAAGNKIRHYYQYSDVRKGDYHQITDTGNGYEIHLKSPVYKEPKRIFIDYSEAAAVMAMFKIIGMRQESPSINDYYKIFQERKK